MTHTIEITDETLALLQTWAIPLKDNFDTVIEKLVAEAGAAHRDDMPNDWLEIPEILLPVSGVILDKRQRQMEKFGNNRHLPIGVGLAIIQQELGEAAEAMLEIVAGDRLSLEDERRLIGGVVAHRIAETGTKARSFLKESKNDVPGPGKYREDAIDVTPNETFYKELTEVASSAILLMAAIKRDEKSAIDLQRSSNDGH